MRLDHLLSKENRDMISSMLTTHGRFMIRNIREDRKSDLNRIIIDEFLLLITLFSFQSPLDNMNIECIVKA